MKFVSRHGGHSISVDGGASRPVLSREGVTTWIESAPILQADFKVRVLTPTEIDAAKEQMFLHAKDGNNVFGAVPSSEPGLLGVEEGVAAGYGHLNYEGYDPYQGLGSFDTEDPLQCPPDRRHEVEQFLLSCNEFNQSFVRVDNWNLTPPWPTYPTGDINAETIASLVRFAKAGGLLVPAINYEKSGPSRPELVAAFEAALAEEQKEAIITDGLSATV